MEIPFADNWFIYLPFLAVLIVFYLGLFKSMNPKENEFHGGTFFYRHFQGPMSALGKEFTLINKHVRDYTDKLPKPVPYPSAGIYYDDPQDLVDPNTFRATTGFIVRVKNDTVADHFK